MIHSATRHLDLRQNRGIGACVMCVWRWGQGVGGDGVMCEEVGGRGVCKIR